MLSKAITIKARSSIGVRRAPLMAGARDTRLNSPPSKALIYMRRTHRFEPSSHHLTTLCYLDASIQNHIWA